VIDGIEKRGEIFWFLIKIYIMLSLKEFRKFEVSKDGNYNLKGGDSWITWKGQIEINGKYHNACDMFVEGLEG